MTIHERPNQAGKIQECRFDSSDALTQALAAQIADDLRAALAKDGTASLALSGGRTPLPLFQALSRVDLDWSKVWVTLVDDRWVAVEHADSNEALLRANLLQNYASAARFIGLKNAATTPTVGLADATRALSVISQPFTVLVLGMGDDGHTASWFPESPQLAGAVSMDSGQMLAATDPVTAAHWRMTLTLPVVLAAKRIVVHTVGAGKWAVYQNALAGNDKNAMPIRYVLQSGHPQLSVYWAS